MLVELIGPAGAGKSTLSRVLCANGRARRATMWEVPRPRLVRHSLQLMWPWLGVVRSSRSLRWRAFKHVVRLDALGEMLDRHRRNGRDDILLLDEGPIFALSWLVVFGPARLNDRDAWRRRLQRGAALVDAVVVLDAPDPVLAHRIRGRVKPHPIKHLSDPEIFAFSSRFRVAFEQVLADLRVAPERPGPGPRVLTLETGAAAPAELAERVLTALEDGRHGH